MFVGLVITEEFCRTVTGRNRLNAGKGISVCFAAVGVRLLDFLKGYDFGQRKECAHRNRGPMRDFHVAFWVVGLAGGKPNRRIGGGCAFGGTESASKQNASLFDRPSENPANSAHRDLWSG